MKNKVIIFILLLCASQLHSQEFILKGKVTDPEKEDAIGVSVYNEVNKKETMTDLYGYYDIKAHRGDTITFSYSGCLTQKMAATDTVCNIILENDGKEPEIVLVGYKTENKRALLQEVNLDSLSIKARDRQSPVSIISSSDTPRIRIRGNASLSKANEPIMVINGDTASMDILTRMDTTMIAFVSIMKDTATPWPMSRRGSNGVIVIETKPIDTVKGFVRFLDAAQGIAEVRVLNKTTKKYVMTNTNGEYHIAASKGDILEFSLNGYVKQQKKVNIPIHDIILKRED